MAMNFRNSDEASKVLRSLIPGGAHTYSKGNDQWPQNAPPCIEKGNGCFVWDLEGNRYLDWSMGLTSVAFGHANSEINSAAIEAMALGHNFQRPSVMEAKAAFAILNFLQDRGEMVKFAKNGSTVTSAAVKLSRAFTGRELVGICSDHPFFSYDDWFIGSTKCASGVPNAVSNLNRKFQYNDIESVRKMFLQNKNKIACLILEPVKIEPPKNNYLQLVRELCIENKAILILDEMVTGFKWHKQGAGKYYGIDADLYTWGKGLANGHSVCALTGRRDIMELGGIEHSKPKVFLTSTTNGAEIPQLAALIKTLEIIDRDPYIYEKNWKKGRDLKAKLNQLVMDEKLEQNISFVGEDCFFIMSIQNCKNHASNVAKTYFLQELIKEGQLFQGLFYPTIAHTEEAIELTLHAWKKVLPKFKIFLETGCRADLQGEPIKPVFRSFNSCECLTAEDCLNCQMKLKEIDSLLILD